MTSTNLPRVRLRFQLAVFMLIRTVVHTAWRMLYPFLPAIARGVGVATGSVALIVSARSPLGMASPLLGSVADRWGRKTTMLASLGLFAASLLALAAWPSFPMLFVTMLTAAVGKFVFDAAMYAYLGDTVDYSRRGLATAIVELGWSGAFLIGIPLAGWLIERSGWSAPFLWIALAGAGLWLVLWRILPADARHADARPSLIAGFRTVVGHPAALAGLGVGMLINSGNELVSIVYGVWMEDSFGLRVAALGLASAVIGIAELGGEGGVAMLADRLGKKRAVGMGIAATIVMCFALPLVGQSIIGALAGLFLFYITAEFTLVSSLSMMTELAPTARATFMAGYVAALSAGRALGALAGTALFEFGDGLVPGMPLLVNGIAAAVLNGLALALLLVFVK